MKKVSKKIMKEILTKAVSVVTTKHRYELELERTKNKLDGQIIKITKRPIGVYDVIIEDYNGNDMIKESKMESLTHEEVVKIISKQLRGRDVVEATIYDEDNFMHSKWIYKNDIGFSDIDFAGEVICENQQLLNEMLCLCVRDWSEQGSDWCQMYHGESRRLIKMEFVNDKLLENGYEEKMNELIINYIARKL